MTVTGLRQTAPERYEISFDDGSTLKAPFSVVADHSIYTGRELTDEEYLAVVSASQLGQAKERALKIIGARPMSERELYDRLVQKGESEQNAAECIAWLVGMHLLDDGDYARILVRHYAAKGFGTRRIQDELYRRKVPKSLWDGALGEMSPQDDTVDRLLRSRLKSAEPDRAELKRATDALMRRGFSWDEIRAAVARYNSGIEEEN